MKTRTYEAVTDMPVIVPAKLIPTEKPGGTQSFHIYFPPIPNIHKKGEKPSGYIYTPVSDEPVVILRWLDLSPNSRVGARLWRGVVKKTKSELLLCLGLCYQINKGKLPTHLAKLYRQLAGKIWYDDEPDTWPSLFVSESRHRTGSRSEDFANVLEREGKHHTVVAGIVSEALKHARLVLWVQNRRLIPAIFCNTLELAVYALALPMFAAGRSLGLCEWCQCLFLKSRTDQVHCCTRHADNARVARWRTKNRT